MIVLEGQVVDLALLQSKHMPMQLAHVAAKHGQGVQLHREAWPITVLDMRYAPRVLHFSAFHLYVTVMLSNCVFFRIMHFYLCEM